MASLLGVGLNQFLLAQGYARQGMIAVVLGALANLVLDPLLIFGFGLGVRGVRDNDLLYQLVEAKDCLVCQEDEDEEDRLRRELEAMKPAPACQNRPERV